MVLETIDPYQDAERAHDASTKAFAASLDDNQATADPAREDAREEEDPASDGGDSLRGYAKDLRGSLSDPSGDQMPAEEEGRDAAAENEEGRDGVPEEGESAADAAPAGIFNVGSSGQEGGLEASPSLATTPSLMDTLQETAGSWIDAVCGTPFVGEAPPVPSPDAGTAAEAADPAADTVAATVEQAPSDDGAAAYVPPVLAAAQQQPADPLPVTMEGVTRSSGSFHSVVESASSGPTEVKLELAEEEEGTKEGEEKGENAPAEEAAPADEAKADAESPDADAEPAADPHDLEKEHCPTAPSKEGKEDEEDREDKEDDAAEDVPAAEEAADEEEDAAPKKRMLSFRRKSKLTEQAQAAKQEEKEKEAQAAPKKTKKTKKTKMPSMRSSSRSKSRPPVQPTGLEAYNAAMAKKRAELGLPPPDKTPEAAAPAEEAAAAPKKTKKKSKKPSMRSRSRSKSRPPVQPTGLEAYNVAMAKKRAELGVE